MKLLKFILFAVGIIGLIASIYNINVENTLSGHKLGLISSIFLISLAIKTSFFKSLLNINTDGGFWK